jgi:hypothetical protein
MSQETRSSRIGIQTDASTGNRAALVLKKEIKFAPIVQEKREILPDVSNPKKFVGGIRNCSFVSQWTGYELSGQNLKHSPEHPQFISDRDFIAAIPRNEVASA